jgi:AcrR family transcriptional regulator
MAKPTTTKSYQAILSGAKSLFWAYGIRKVTVEEICEKAGVSKMTFYRNFNNKLEVAEQIIKQIVDQAMEDYDAIMEQEIPFSEKIALFVELKHKNAKGISFEFVSDIVGNDYPELKGRLGKYQELMFQNIIRDFTKAQQQGWIRKDLKIPFMIHMLNMINEHLLDEQLVAMYDSTTDLIMELTNFFFYGISSKSS